MNYQRERERERERERVYWGSLKWGSKDEQVGECMTSREKNDPLELRGKRISQSHGKDKLVWNIITNWFSLARPNCFPWPMNDYTRVRWERSLDGLDWERESEEEKRIKRNKEGKRGKSERRKNFFIKNIKVQFFIWKILIFFSTYLSQKKKI